MRFEIKHEIKGRLRVAVLDQVMTYKDADTLQYYLQNTETITAVKIHERTGSITINYEGDRLVILEALKNFTCTKYPAPDDYLLNTGREINDNYKSALVQKVVLRYASKIFIPYPIRTIGTTLRAIKYVYRGLRSLRKRKLDVAVLDASSIAVSILRNDIKTAGSIMFLLSLGELLEEWTHKKSVDDLARSMSLNVGKVWLISNGLEILVPPTDIKIGDKIVIHMGNVIPFDGVVINGEAMVNQVSLTGESAPIMRTARSFVYAGTVVEEGELIIEVRADGGSSRYEKIVTMIEESEKLKSSLESKAEHLADKLVPYTLFGTGLTYLFTRNITKALSILMVDFSCALKLAMPVAVLSAIREASQHNIMVKGGKFLEYVSEADTIVFDKTGTLTISKPSVARVISFNGENPDELLRIAACIDEHFPHSMAKAVVEAAKAKKLVHEEMHSKVEYIVAHGISTTIDNKKAIIGSYHFVFEDEKCEVPEGMEEKFDDLPVEYSHLYLAIENKLAAVICIEDPLRKEAKDVVDKLREIGFKKIIMMTGDSERTAKAIARKVGVDEYYSEVLPETKAKLIENERRQGSRVIMVGDGINDSPALSAADIGIAISDGAEIAREIADITIDGENLNSIVILKQISDALMKRISKNYKTIVGINTGLLVLGVIGLIQPTTSSLLHNTSTILISTQGMKNLLTKEV